MHLRRAHGKPRADERRGKMDAGFHGREGGKSERSPSPRTCNIPCAMKAYTAVIERCPETGLYVGYVPRFPGAHGQGATQEEPRANLREVLRMLLEDGEPRLEAEFIGTQALTV
jgi:predicted RNase H-like HicB family nuclease